MKRNFSDYLIAFGVIVCSLVLLGALAYALGGREQRTSRRLEIDFTDVTGIRLHSELRYAGAPAGSVSHIRLLSNEERSATVGGKPRWNAVRVRVDLFDGVPDIPSDAVASISSDTLLSEKFIALSAGSPQAPKLEDGALLQGRSGASLDDLLGSVEPVLKSIDQILNSIDPVVKKTTETLDSLKDGIDDALPKFGKVADTAQSAIISAQTLLKRADKLIADNEGAVKVNLDELKMSLDEMQALLKTANGTVGSVDKTVGNVDKQLAARMKELSVILQNLKVVTTQAKAFTQTIGERPHRVIFGGKPQELTPEAEILRSEKPVPATRR